MENYSQSRRNRQSTASSPQFCRGNTGATLSETRSSTPRFRSSKLEENPKTPARETQKKKSDENSIKAGDDGFVRFLPRSSSKVEVEVKRRSRSNSTSPSAWALSPGRSQRPCSSPAHVEMAPLPKSPATFDILMKKETSRSGGVSGVLNYFRQKRVSPVLEEEYHQYRILYSRLLQWRFANARAEASMANVERVAKKKLFNGWARIFVMRDFIVENRIKIQTLKHNIKLYRIFQYEMNLLNRWSRLEPKNIEAVGRVVRKLSAISNCLPLVQSAEADLISVSDDMSSAMDVMDNVQTMILDMHWQKVERACFLATELSIMLKEQKHFVEELEKKMAMVESMEVWEKSLRVHCFQLVKCTTTALH